MKKYFGTDGFRGIANQDLTAEHAYKIGRFLGNSLSNKKRVAIGKDTRISGDMLECSLIAGLLSSGADVYKLGVITTPGVCYVTKSNEFDYGVMISASHNPVQDNGIKIFSATGYKLTDEEELKIEAFIDGIDDLPHPIGKEVGTIIDFTSGDEAYVKFLESTINVRFDGLHIALDCANGSTSFLAKQLFTELGAKVSLIGANPDGKNINDQCGSTHPEKLSAFVLESKADLGLAFDGDGDRLIAVDHQGNIVDGDQIMFILGQKLKNQNKLNNNTIVSTVMSNLGFYHAIKEHGLNSVKTQVGDRYVLEEMLKSGYNLGGEQSGHIIFLDYITTGDGLLSGIQLVSNLILEGKSLQDLANQMNKYPQLLKNIRVSDKDIVMNSPLVKQAILDAETSMGDEGRVLVRPSGTEALIRVMVEAKTDELCEMYVNNILNVIKEVV